MIVMRAAGQFSCFLHVTSDIFCKQAIWKYPENQYVMDQQWLSNICVEIQCCSKLFLIAALPKFVTFLSVRLLVLMVHFAPK